MAGVVVGTANTELGKLALDRAVQEAALRDVPILLVGHVPVPGNETSASEYPERRKRVESATEGAAREVEQHGPRCIAYVPAAPMKASEALLSAAMEHDADLIVIGIPRRSPVGKTVLRSTSQDVLLGADCPVLGVKLPTDQTKH
jgi:nucleotide-binding universal stress UspA family protein